MLEYLKAVIRYYKLSIITLGSNQTNRKKTNIQISRKLSRSSIIIWIIMCVFCVISTMGADPINVVTKNNKFGTVTYNSKWWIYLIVAIIIMAITIFKSLSLFKKIEHKPSNLNIYQREKPSNLRPAHVRLLLNDGLVDKVSLAATLVDLIDRGYLVIEKYETVKNTIFRNKEIVLRKTEKNTDNLLKFEKFIIEWFIDKYGNGKEVSMKEVENRLKVNSDQEKPSDLFDNWIGLVFLSFPLKNYYDEYRVNNTGKLKLYLVMIILGILPIIPFVRNFRNIWYGMYVVCFTNIYIK